MNEQGVSRRDAIIATAGAAAGVAAIGIAKASPASAAAGQAVIQGATNAVGTAETIVRSSPSGDKATVVLFNDNPNAAPVAGPVPDALRVFAVGPGTGAAIDAFCGQSTFSAVDTSQRGIALRGIGRSRGLYAKALTALSPSGGSSYGVECEGGVGILATGQTSGVQGLAMQMTQGIGVFGRSFSTDSQGAGVVGECTSGVGVRSFGNRGVEAIGVVTGVYAESQGAGTAVVASNVVPDGSFGGLALDVRGPARFSTAGVVQFAAGQTAKVVASPVDLLPTSIVLATSQKQGGVVSNVFVNNVANTITIRLTQPATQAIPVAWIVLNR